MNLHDLSRRPVPAVNAFHVCGAILAIWAVIVSVLGITRENFPTSDGSARWSADLAAPRAAAIGTAIYTSATEEHEDGEGEPEEAALLVAPV